MLKNELKDIEELLHDSGGRFSVNYSALDLHERIERIQEAWLNVVFSELPKSSLERYLHFHLEGITKISDILFGLELQESEHIQYELLSLIDHLRDYYDHLLNWDTKSPEVYRRRLLCKLNPVLDMISNGLNNSAIDPLLKNSIRLWLDEMSRNQKNVRFTFRSLTYMEKLVNALASFDWAVDDISATLVPMLYRSNFNHLSFLKFLQNDIVATLEDLAAESRLDYFKTKEAEFMSIPLEYNCAYDNSWPSIKVMVTGWLKEQNKLSEFTIKREQENKQVLFGNKLVLNMSVAHLACLIKLFYEEEVFATENLRSIFKFYAANYESKRQPAISWESLSKEYYSLDSHTATRIKKVLQKMIDNLNRDFFPVMAAISIGLGIYSGIQ